MFFKKPDNKQPEHGADEDKTLLIGRPTPQERLPWPARDSDSKATHPLDGKESSRAPQGTSGRPPAGRQERRDTSDQTRLISSHRSEAQAGAGEDLGEPVVAWFVVVEGKGKGRSVEISAGSSPIGRSDGQRIRIDFGDDQISRESHAVLTFDVRSGRFFIAHGGGKNLTYIGDEPILVPVELKGGELVSVGETTLKFVPFCGPDFLWK